MTGRFPLGRRSHHRMLCKCHSPVGNLRSSQQHHSFHPHILKDILRSPRAVLYVSLRYSFHLHKLLYIHRSPAAVHPFEAIAYPVATLRSALTVVRAGFTRFIAVAEKSPQTGSQIGQSSGRFCGFLRRQCRPRDHWALPAVRTAIHTILCVHVTEAISTASPAIRFTACTVFRSFTGSIATHRRAGPAIVRAVSTSLCGSAGSILQRRGMRRSHLRSPHILLGHMSRLRKRQGMRRYLRNPHILLWVHTFHHRKRRHAPQSSAQSAHPSVGPHVPHQTSGHAPQSSAQSASFCGSTRSITTDVGAYANLPHSPHIPPWVRKFRLHRHLGMHRSLPDRCHRFRLLRNCHPHTQQAHSRPDIRWRRGQFSDTFPEGQFDDQNTVHNRSGGITTHVCNIRRACGACGSGSVSTPGPQNGQEFTLHIHDIGNPRPSRSPTGSRHSCPAVAIIGMKHQCKCGNAATMRLFCKRSPRCRDVSSMGSYLQVLRVPSNVAHSFG